MDTDPVDRCRMNHGVASLHAAADRLRVAEVALDNLPGPRKRRRIADEGDDLVAAGLEPPRHLAADEAGRTGEKHPHLALAFHT